MYILDTNTIIDILRQNRATLIKLDQTLLSGASLFIITLVYYEVQRGILYAHATGQAQRFVKLLQNVTTLGVDGSQVLNKASEIHSELKKNGQTVEDVDIFVMAVALLRDLTIVTNDPDFLRAVGVIPNLKIEQWPR